MRRRDKNIRDGMERSTRGDPRSTLLDPAGIYGIKILTLCQRMKNGGLRNNRASCPAKFRLQRSTRSFQRNRDRIFIRARVRTILQVRWERQQIKSYFASINLS